MLAHHGHFLPPARTSSSDSGLPRLVILPRMMLSCRGMRPTRPAKSRPRSNVSPLPTAATIDVEIIGPMPGIIMMLGQFSSVQLVCSISPEASSICLSSHRPDQNAAHWKQYLIPSLVEGCLEGILRCAQPRPDGDALFDQHSPDLVGGGGAPRNQSCPNPMQGLKVEPIMIFLRDGSKIGPQRGICDRLGVIIIVLLAHVERLYVNRR